MDKHKVEAFADQHASAIFGLVGALGGGLLSFVASLLLRKRDYTLRVWEKLLERRIQAHEDVIAMALEMRIMVGLGGIEHGGEVARAPEVLLTKDEFERWFARFAKLSFNRSTWLTTNTKRELNFAQDYLVTLWENLRDVPSDKYIAVGQVVRQDFIDLSSSLEKSAYSFFGRKVTRLALDDINEWHKYERSQTEERLMGMILMKNWAEIQRIISAKT